MTSENAEKPAVKVRIPGPQNFTPEQREAIHELLSDLRAEGYEATWPIRRTASTAQAILDVIGIYMAARGSKRAIDRVTDDTVDYVVDTAEDLLRKGIDWAKRQFKRNPRQDDDEPPRTTTVVIYGPDGQPLKSIKVVEDDEADSDGNESR
jgi:hypothetical protein